MNELTRSKSSVDLCDSSQQRSRFRSAEVGQSGHLFVQVSREKVVGQSFRQITVRKAGVIPSSSIYRKKGPSDCGQRLQFLQAGLLSIHCKTRALVGPIDNFSLKYTRNVSDYFYSCSG